MIKMPGKSYDGPLPSLTEEETALRDALRQDVETLAGEIGERNVFRYPRLVAAADFIKRSFENAGYAVRREGFEASGQTCYNLEAEITGVDTPDEIVVVGGHYDSVLGCRALTTTPRGSPPRWRWRARFRAKNRRGRCVSSRLSTRSRPFFRPIRWEVWCTRKDAAIATKTSSRC